MRAVVIKATGNQKDSDPKSGLAALAERLNEMDVHEFGRLSANLVQQVGNSIDRRGLLLKLAAGMSLAAVAPAISTFEADAAQSDSPSARDDRFSGVWHSRYIYYSSGRRKELTGEHYVALTRQENHVTGQSLPNSLHSLLTFDFSVADSVATGTWSSGPLRPDTTREQSTVASFNC